MVRRQRRSRSAADLPSAVPSVRRILFAPEDSLFGLLVMTVLSLILSIVFTIEGWYNDWQIDLVRFVTVAVVSLLCVSVFSAQVVSRVRSVRGLMAAGLRVQAQIRKVVPDKCQRPVIRSLAPQVVVHYRYQVDGTDYDRDIRIDRSIASELADAIWLRVDPADPRQAVIEQFYL